MGNQQMRHLVAGTAGHIDHGKTSLVKALTGIDADRLREEKERGITIDIGFAHMQLTPEMVVSFVDLPGHERFVKNMLAGVAGIDVVLFVIAADESIKPQTREHFEICRLLGIRQGIVVLTKADTVDADALDYVRLEVEEFVAGSFLADSPVVAVSARIGMGLERLREELLRVGRIITARESDGYFRVPLDRAFTVRGTGTVVTGTLVSGSLAKETEVEIYPVGRPLRVRGLQVHGRPVDRAVAGQRVAVNLAGIEPAEISRGMVLAEPKRFRATKLVDCSIELLSSAQALKHRAPIHFHAGSAEIEAEVRLFRGAAAIQPGEKSHARIVLREPALLLPGDRFILRKFSPVTTIGGGSVIDVTPPRYRLREDVSARLTVLAGPDVKERIALLVREAARVLTIAELAARTGLTEQVIREHGPTVRILAPGLVVDREWFATQAKKMERQVAEFHLANPLAPGMPRQSFDAPGVILEQLLRESPELVVEGELVRMRTHRIVLQEDEEQARAAIEQAFEQAGLTTPEVGEVLARSGVETARARALLQSLLREKKLVRVGAELVFHEHVIVLLRQLMAKHKGEKFNVGAFKDWTGISRKYAIPLLEFLDRERLTRREGEVRVVL
jgi:selenocysteine-specific elongation factor